MRPVQQEASHGELARLASTDFLTAAVNRRCVMERVGAELWPGPGVAAMS